MDFKPSHRHLRYCPPQDLNRILNHLRGFINGLDIDSKIQEKEVEALRQWVADNEAYRQLNPFNELIPVIERALEDGIVDALEIADIRWLIGQALDRHYFHDIVISDLYQLQGILNGILADEIIDKEEAEQLARWISENDHLACSYPYDEIFTILTGCLEDGKLDEHEIEFLKSFFHEFADRILKDPMARFSVDKKQMSILGICATNPKITFPKKRFSFAGNPIQTDAFRQSVSKVKLLSGNYSEEVDRHLDYLVVAKQSNPSWSFACYGRKISQAIELRENGSKVLIVNESDFWKACR